MPPSPVVPPRRGLSTGAIVAAALGGVVVVFGLLIAAVLVLGSSSETRYVTVGESIKGSSSSSKPDRSSAQPKAKPVQSGLVLSETDLAKVPGLANRDLDLEQSEASAGQELTSYCNDETYTAAKSIEERWGGSGWEIDVLVASAASPSEARQRVLDRQTPAFLECAAHQYEARGPWRIGKMDGEVVDHEEVTTGDELSTTAVVEGRMDPCDGTMAIAYRQVGSVTVSVRMFGCIHERYGVDPPFAIDDADGLAATIADRLGG